MPRVQGVEEVTKLIDVHLINAIIAREERTCGNLTCKLIGISDY